LVNRLHELAAQSVKIVVPASMVTIAKSVKLESTTHLLWMIPQLVLHAIVDGINLTMGKQVVFRVHQESLAI
jgi:hypothetical protein